MDRLQTLQNRLTADGWRYPLIAGLVSASFTVVHYWLFAADLLRFESVFLAGLLGGVLYNSKEIASRRVGVRTGLVSVLPVLWTLFDALMFIPRLAQPAWFGSVQVLLLFLAIGFMTALSAVTGMVGALLGDWLTEKTEPYRPFVAGG